MTVKVVLYVCAQALVIQLITGQCIGAGYPGPYGTPLGPAPYSASWGTAPCAGAWPSAYNPAAAAASHGGGLPVASASPIPPSGVTVASENAYAGELGVRGALPFLSSISLEGALPTVGAGAVAYGCGNGAVGMLTEDIGTGIGPYDAIGPYGYRADAYGYGVGALGYEAPLVGPGIGRAGCGCGRAAYI